MKVLVTGVAGFIGSSIARRLLEEGHTVVGIDAMTDYYDADLKAQNLNSLPQTDAFDFIHGDLNDVDIDGLLRDVEVVFHHAGQPGVRKSWGEEFGIYLSQNVHSTQRLLEAAGRTKTLKRFVYASSSSIYGDAERFPTTELDRPQPISPYGVTKLAAEHLCTLYARNFGVPAVSLRYFTVYGPRQRPDMAFTRFIKAALTGGEITIFGSGEQIRDFTYIDDVVNANMLAAFTDGVEPGSVFNVAGGTSISVNEVLVIVEKLAGRPLNVRRIGAVAGDVSRTGGSTQKIREALGWEARVSIDAGLAGHFAWARSALSHEGKIR